MRFLSLQPLTLDRLTEALELDRLALGGLWSAEGYLREIDSPNSDLLIMTPHAPRSTAHSSLALGCSWAIVEEAHLTIVAVHPGYQRQGLGQAMLVALLTAACDRKLERATLEVRASNESAISLYQKFGFKEAGRRKRYYQDTGEDALVMWLSGLHHPEFLAKLAEWRRTVSDRLAQSGWELEF